MAARKHEIDQYMAHRPEYPPTLWALFTTYHQGALQKAHDIGSGFGNGMEGLLSLLASREQGNLSHAILTEPKQFLVEAASASLPPRFPNTKFAWRNKKGEDSWDAPLGLQEGELDLAMSCEAIHWTILETSLENVHRSLRTNGTFAAVLYAPLPNIVGNLAATKILQSLVQDHVQELIASGWMDEGWKRCMVRELCVVLFLVVAVNDFNVPLTHIGLFIASVVQRLERLAFSRRQMERRQAHRTQLSGWLVAT